MASTTTDSKRSDTDDTNTIESNSSDFHTPKFKFPSAPRLCKSANNTSCSVSCQSDSSISDGQIVKWKKRNRRRPPKLLPPIGVFWDIENCQVPKNKSASSIVQKIRELFFDGYREAEFIVVCDVKKENAQIIQDLHDAQVNLIHVSSTSKNAADEKLRQSLRRFAETHSAPAAVVLISGDINFAADLSDLRYRKKIHVILVHNTNVADALVLCANDSFSYSHITENLPVLKTKVTSQYEVLISNLPTNYDKNKLKNRLRLLSDNCGGRVVNVDSEKGTAILKFSSLDFAVRAQRRLKGEDVFGYKIGVSNPTTARDSPCRSYTGRKSKSADAYQMQSYSYPPAEFTLPDSGLYYSNNQNCAKDTWKPYQDQDIQTKLNVHEQLFRPVRGASNFLSDQVWLSPFRDCRPPTPQDDGAAACVYATQNWPIKFAQQSISNEANKGFFQNAGGKSQNSSAPIDLVVSNLDPSVDIKELPKILTNLLKEYVMILNLSIHLQADSCPIAIVKVANQQEAQMAISHLHHYKLGHKKLSISYAQSGHLLDPVHLREMVIASLQEVPGNRMPLFKLIDLLESRYHANVSVSEINKLKDICRITDELGGRIISLTSDVRTSPQGNISRTSILYCSVHCLNGLETRGWGEVETSQLPNMIMPLKLFSEKVNELLSSHMGTLPLLSFPICYKVEFNESLPVDENGVPLEHLVTCVKNVDLKLGGHNRNIKYIKREIKVNTIDVVKDESILKSSSPSIVSNIQLLCRELVDLLKTTDRCQIPLGRLIPAYHHHFGRQCRVADYGYTKLIDLLESQIVSGVVQILGYGTRRFITLTHSTQVRRFTSDLLRVLKGQVSRQLTANEFPNAYERVVGKTFNPIEYGLCSLDDLLDEVPDNTVVITKRNGTIGIAIPKREQTAEEIVRTKQFADEVVKLLSYSPECSMLFNKFVPAYHHHFGHQCKVSDYGFTKLIELFEAIPDTVRIEEMTDGERRVLLTLPRALKVLGEQIVNIIKHSKLASVPLESLPSCFLREYGYSLKPESYDSVDYNELISKLSEFVQVTQSTVGPLLILAHSESNSTISLRVWASLLLPPHYLNVSVLIGQYRNKFQSNLSVLKLEQLTEVVIVNSTEGTVTLTPFYILAAQMYSVVYRAGGQVSYSNLENLYKRNYNKEISYSSLGVKSLEDLISRLNFMVLIRGSRKKTTIVLNQKLAEYGVPLPLLNSNDNHTSKKEEGVHWPPPPAHDILLTPKSYKRVTPPKPDSPPTPGSAWSAWSSPSKFNNSVDLTIPMPMAHTLKLSGFDALISPTKNLLPAHSYQLSSVLATITPPHPTEVPMPDKLLGKDDSNDSGVLVSNSNIASEGEMDVSGGEQTGKAPSTIVIVGGLSSYATIRASQTQLYPVSCDVCFLYLPYIVRGQTQTRFDPIEIISYIQYVK